MKRCISVDWLTMYCESAMIVESRKYEWRKMEHGSAQFKDVYKVYDRECGEMYCIVQAHPYSPIIPKKAVMVQVANRFLYYKNWNVTVNNFMYVSNIKPLSISRIDIACDFNCFAKGLHPESVIRGIVSEKYRHVGRSKGHVEFSNRQGVEFEYLRFGNRDSEICTYLYNKTRELKEVQDKPYIREMWKNSGLDVDKDVWRLEVSLSNTQMRTIVKSTGEILRIDLDFLHTQGMVENVYHCAIGKSFDIRFNEQGKRTNKMTKVLLFDKAATTLLMTIPTNEAKTNRVDRILVKRLANHYSMYRIDDPDKAKTVLNALGVLLENEVLSDYYYEKVAPLIGWYKER